MILKASFSKLSSNQVLFIVLAILLGVVQGANVYEPAQTIIVGDSIYGIDIDDAN